MLPPNLVRGVAAVLASACAALSAPVRETVAPLVQAPGTDAVPDRYMVMLKKDVSWAAYLQHAAAVTSMYAGPDASPFTHTYDLGDAMRGYAGHFPPDMLEFIRRQPEVDFVERDSIVRVDMIEGPSRVSTMDELAMREMALPWDDPYRHVTEDGAPWGLARISHRPGLSLGTFNKYVYEVQGGEGVTAYIIDTGVNIHHVDFGGRARWGKTIPVNDTDTDDHGHGTHVAGTIASNTFGVAKRAEVVAVKVLGAHGQGTMSDVTAGVLWAVADAEAKTRAMLAAPSSAAARKHRGFVSNMSLGGMKSPTLDRAVSGAVAAGMHFGVAAGNENQDACNVSPADVRTAVTVGASTIADERAYFSNTGPCVDIFAPGLNILSTWANSNRSINTISGTSMATPHIVGLMAYLLSIYGSDDFHWMDGAQPTMFARPAPSSWAHTAVQAVHALVPAWLSRALPTHAWLSQPVSARVESALRPADLKKAMRRMATSNTLSNLDPETINKLAFNNATSTQRA